MADGSSWALPTGTSGVNPTLCFCQIRARCDAELSYREEQRGDRGGAGVCGSVEGTAGQPAAKGCTQLPTRAGRTWGSSLFQNPEFCSQPVTEAGKLDTAQTGQGNSA